MTAMLDQHIRTLAEEGLQINIWPTDRGFQINVKEAAGSGWTIVSHADAVEGLETALRQRLSRSSLRHVVVDPEPAQMDIEDAIAKVAPRSRYLIWHPESGSLFESDVFDVGDGLCEDVTDIPEYEKRFAADGLDDLIG